MVDTWGVGIAIGVMALLLAVNFMIHFGAYALLARLGWFHPPHHDDDGMCACDLEDVREGHRSHDSGLLRPPRSRWRTASSSGRGGMPHTADRGHGTTKDMNTHNDGRRE